MGTNCRRGCRQAASSAAPRLGLAMMAGLIAACGQPTAPAPTTAPVATRPTEAAKPVATAAQPAAAKPGDPSRLTDGKIVLAVINDQSSVAADFSGVKGVQAVKMAADDFTARYGADVLGGPVELINADHQNKPDLANSKAQEFYDRNGADVILDVGNSAAALAVANQAKEKRRLHVNITAGTTELTGAQCNKYTFHYSYDTWMLANGTGTEVTRKLGKRWYIIYPNYAYGQDMDRSFQAAITAAGGEVVASDATPFPSDDFSTFLLKAPTLRPDILGVMQPATDMINAVKQNNEFKLRDQGITLAIGLLADSDIAALGPEAFAGATYTTPWVWTLDEQSRAWADKFQAVTGSRPTYSQAGNYSAATQYLEAVRRAGTDDADAVVGALRGYRFDDFFIRNGLIRPEDHRVVHDAYLAQVKPPGEVAEPWDFSRVVSTIPAAQAFRTVEESRQAGCNMPQ